MKAQPSPEPTDPPIAALPPPSELDVLREKLAQSETNEAALSRQCSALTETNEILSDRLAVVEKNSFSFALSNIDAGHVLEEAGTELMRLASLVAERQEPGELVVKIKVKPHQANAHEFNAAIKVTEPKVEPFRAIFFRNDDGQLTRQDPRQRELPLRA